MKKIFLIAIIGTILTFSMATATTPIKKAVATNPNEEGKIIIVEEYRETDKYGKEKNKTDVPREIKRTTEGATETQIFKNVYKKPLLEKVGLKQKNYAPDRTSQTTYDSEDRTKITGYKTYEKFKPTKEKPRDEHSDFVIKYNGDGDEIIEKHNYKSGEVKKEFTIEENAKKIKKLQKKEDKKNGNIIFAEFLNDIKEASQFETSNSQILSTLNSIESKIKSNNRLTNKEKRKLKREIKNSKKSIENALISEAGCNNLKGKEKRQCKRKVKQSM